jgi:hypothetical protein
MALKNPSANCFRKFKGLQLTFQVVKRGSIDKHMFVEQPYAASAIWSGSLLCISSSKRPYGLTW